MIPVGMGNVVAERYREHFGAWRSLVSAPALGAGEHVALGGRFSLLSDRFRGSSGPARKRLFRPIAATFGPRGHSLAQCGASA